MQQGEGRRAKQGQGRDLILLFKVNAPSAISRALYAHVPTDLLPKRIRTQRSPVKKDDKVQAKAYPLLLAMLLNLPERSTAKRKFSACDWMCVKREILRGTVRHESEHTSRIQEATSPTDTLFPGHLFCSELIANHERARKMWGTWYVWGLRKVGDIHTPHVVMRIRRHGLLSLLAVFDHDDKLS